MFNKLKFKNLKSNYKRKNKKLSLSHQTYKFKNEKQKISKKIDRSEYYMI
jgi:hypothetical protein